jgi:hypothetical protein
VPEGYQPFLPGYYEGRVDLMLTVLEDIFGLPSSGTGRGGTTRIAEKEGFQWALHQSTPNPAAAQTKIRYEVARTCNVCLNVYNARGQLVRAVVNERQAPGRYAAYWDGTNSAGQGVSSGVYFYRMEAGDYSAVRKMLVVR